MDDTFHCKWYFACSESQNKEFYPKNYSKSILQSEISVSQGHTNILAGNYGYSLHLSGSGEVQAVACTEQGIAKFNIVHFVCICSISTVHNSNLLHNVYLFLWQLLASVLGHFHAARCSVDVCSLYVNVFGNSLYIWLKLQIKSKYLYPWNQITTLKLSFTWF